jgi:hypothetical protein
VTLILFKVDATSNVHWLDFNKGILIVLDVVKGRGSIKKNQTIQTDRLNTFREIQTVFTVFTLLSVLLDTLYIVFFYCTNISVCTNSAHSNNKMGL